MTDERPEADAYETRHLDAYAKDWLEIEPDAFFGPRIMMWAADRIRALEEELKQYEQ